MDKKDSIKVKYFRIKKIVTRVDLVSMRLDHA